MHKSASFSKFLGPCFTNIFWENW